MDALTRHFYTKWVELFFNFEWLPWPISDVRRSTYDTDPTTVGKPYRPKSDQAGATTTFRSKLQFLKCVAPTPGQRAGARPAALAERAERACEASGTTSKTGSAALDQSEGSCWWATQARFELRLRAAASAAARHTEPPGAWLPPRPEQTGVSAAPRHRRRLPLRPQIRH